MTPLDPPPRDVMPPSLPLPWPGKQGSGRSALPCLVTIGPLVGRFISTLLKACFKLAGLGRMAQLHHRNDWPEGPLSITVRC